MHEVHEPRRALFNVLPPLPQFERLITLIICIYHSASSSHYISLSINLYVARLHISEYLFKPPPYFLNSPPPTATKTIIKEDNDARSSIAFVMAPEWEMGMAVDLGMEMAMTASFSTSSAAVAPLNAGASTAAAPGYVNYGSLPPADDFLDLSSLDLLGNSTAADTQLYSAATMEPPAINAGDLQPKHSSFDLYIPQCEDAAELEWLSQFVDDSFSGAPPYESGASAIVPLTDGKLQVEQPANGRGARSKRSRMSAGAVPPATWSSLAAPQQPPALNSPSSSSSSSSSEFPSSKTKVAGGKGKKGGERGGGMEGGVRRCTHCASEKTPQWRTGPLGPKTLCNACGVRFKSGRLVPEYRPAASPTFVLTQHSNSHRKVMELRRQKELLVRRRQDIDSATARPELLYNDYGVC